MNYIEGAKAQLDESQDSDKKIKREAKLGRSALDVQIAQLKAEITKAEAKVEKKEDRYNQIKFSVPFNLKNIDDAEYDLGKANKELDGLKSDLKARESLKKELFPGKK